MYLCLSVGDIVRGSVKGSIPLTGRRDIVISMPFSRGVKLRYCGRASRRRQGNHIREFLKSF